MTEPARIENALRLFLENSGMLRTRDALHLGIHPRTLYRLRELGEIDEISRGVYRLSKWQPLTNRDLVAVAIRVPRAIVCLVSALACHNLTAQIPHAVDIALPSHSQSPKIEGISIRVFWFSEAAFNAGVETIRMDDVPVRIYSPERTVVDCFKYRNKIGIDVAIEALRRYRHGERGTDLPALMKFARIDRVERILQPYLQAVV